MIFWLTSVDLSIIYSGGTLRWFERFVEEESEDAGGGIGVNTVSRHDSILHVCAEILEGVMAGWFSTSSVLCGELTPKNHVVQQGRLCAGQIVAIIRHDLNSYSHRFSRVV